MLYSYDIFDTILYRTILRDSDIFRLMERDSTFSELWDNPQIDFCSARTVSAKNVSKINYIASIEDIYEDIKKTYPNSLCDCEGLIRLELQTEIAYSYLNPAIVSEIRNLIAKGENVCLISDMYFHESQIRQLLSCKDEMFQDIKMYVSCDYHTSKSRINLFRKVKIVENIAYSNWIHTGDNYMSDYRIPSMLGIRAKHIKGSKMFDYEHHMHQYDMDAIYVYQIISETRKNIDLDNQEKMLGISFAGPLVYQYVLWVVLQAEQKGIHKLYFVLRDGYILKLVADEIIKARGIDIETDFLFGSRVAWRKPELTIEKLKNLSVWDKSNWLFRDPAYAYVVYERLGISKDCLSEKMGEDFANQKYFSFSDFKTSLLKALEYSDFECELREKIEESGEMLLGYLLQTIEKNHSFALVDTNSTGKTQSDLQQFLYTHNEQMELQFFYYMYLAEDRNDKNQFIYMDADQDDLRFPEALFRAPYNVCYGYKFDDSKFIPYFYNSESCAWNGRFNYDEYTDGIIAFTRTMELNRSRNISLAYYTDFLLQVANFKVESKDIVECLGNIPFNPDMKGAETQDFYPRLSWKNLFHPFTELIYFPKGSFYRKGGMWIKFYDLLYRLVSLKRTIRGKAK